jgi:hypothetical protein
MCGTADFQAADIQHVLPVSVSRDAEDPTVPVSKYDGTVEGVQAGEDLDDGRLRADGGEAPEAEGETDEPEHVFDCPACGESVDGYPETCPHCQAVYNWGDDEGDEK